MPLPKDILLCIAGAFAAKRLMPVVVKYIK